MAIRENQQLTGPVQDVEVIIEFQGEALPKSGVASRPPNLGNRAKGRLLWDLHSKLCDRRGSFSAQWPCCGHCLDQDFI